MRAISIVLLLCGLIVAGCAGKKAAEKPLLVSLKPKPNSEMNEMAFHHYTNAVIYEQEGLFDEALKEYDLALSYEPMATDIRMSMGQLHLRRNQPSAALDVFLPIAQKTPDTFRLIGDCFRLLRQDAEAEAAYKRAWEGDSTNVAVNISLGFYAARANRIDDAARHMRLAAQLSGNPEFYIRTAEMYAENRMFDSAAVLVEAAIRLQPEDPAHYSRWAIYLFNAGKADSSKAALHLGIKQHPNDARLVAQLIETFNTEDNRDSIRHYGEILTQLQFPDPVIFERMGVVMLRVEMKDLAELILKQALAQSADTSRVALFYLGRLNIEAQKPEAARPFFERLSVIDPKTPDAWSNLALSWQMSKQNDSAAAVLERALEVVETNRDQVLLYYAQFLGQKNLSDSAIAMCRQAIAEGGDTLRALFQIGAEYEKQKKFEKSIESFELLLTIAPDHHQALNYLGYMLADQNLRLDEARSMIERALKADPENGAYLDSYAWVLYRLGEHDKALIQIQKAIQKTKNDPIVLEHLGDIQFALGNLESARDAWKTALAFDPQNTTLREKLNR